MTIKYYHTMVRVTDIDGQEHLLADLAKGYKCIMVVNVATK